MSYHHGYKTPTKLRATIIPEGKKFYETPGQSDDKNRLLAFARTCGDCPAEIEAVTAESVGLEWWRNGKKLPNDEYRKGKWVILHNVIGQAPTTEGEDLNTNKESK